MKYIRTKDGRISYVDYEPNEEVPYYGVITNKGRETCYNIEDVVKTANTIEELCDEFVMINNADKQPFRISVKVILEMRDNNDERCAYGGSSGYVFDYAKEKLEKVREFCGTKEKHDEYANYLYEENPDFKFEVTLYGSIWVDGNLIKVAKMNDKGKLELL